MQSEIQYALDKISKEGSETIVDLVSLVNTTIVVDMAWYRRNTGYPHIMHRLVGTLIIVLSVSIPFIVVLPPLPSLIYPGFPSKDLVVSLFGVLIAFFSGVASFFHWGDLYKANMKAMVEIKNLLLEWQLEMLEAVRHHDSVEGDRLAIKATRKLSNAFRRIDGRNADEHVQYFQLPDKKVG